MNIETVLEAIKEVEKSYFRTNTDTGANSCAMVVWSAFRDKIGLPYLSQKDLPTYDGKEYVMPENSCLLTNGKNGALNCLVELIKKTN